MDDFMGYVNHFLELPEAIIYFLLAFGILFAMYIILFVYTKLVALIKPVKERKQYVRRTFHSLTERFYEIIFSGTSILLFMASYYLIERFYNVEPYKAIWNDYKDFLLLVLIVLSCIINSILDSILIRLKHIDSSAKAAGRLTGMIYMILIFCYIKFIYENNNYDMFITYFLGLMVGRFVYFDASFKDFLINIMAAIRNIPLMIMGLSYTGLMCLYGFTTKYLIKHIGVITDTCITHLFMCFAILILYHTHLSDVLVGKLEGVSNKKKTKKKTNNNTDNKYESEDDN